MFEYRNLKIETSENVYNPSDDSFLAAKLVEGYLKDMLYKGATVLDIGTGTGILGLVAASQEKVRAVVFADVNREAVQLAERNYSANKPLLFASGMFVESNLFSNVSGSFDLIIFNPPYLRHVKDDEKLKDALDGGRQGVGTTIAFLREAVKHLNPAGSIIIVYSSLGNPKMLAGALKEMNLKIVKSDKVHMFFEDIVVLLLSR
jgi:release factor glutamine methyltransferase